MSGISGISLHTYSNASADNTSNTIKQLQYQVKQLQEQYKAVSASQQSSADKQAKLTDLNSQIQQLEMRIQQLQQSESDENQGKNTTRNTEETTNSQSDTQIMNRETMTGLVSAASAYKTAAQIRNAGNTLQGKSNELESNAELDETSSPKLAAREHSEVAAMRSQAQKAAGNAQAKLHDAVSQAQGAGAAANPAQDVNSVQTDNSTASASDTAQKTGAGQASPDDRNTAASKHTRFYQFTPELDVKA